jgi:hypothetical protein
MSAPLPRPADFLTAIKVLFLIYTIKIIRLLGVEFNLEIITAVLSEWKNLPPA